MIEVGAKVWAKTDGNWGNETPVVSVGTGETMEHGKRRRERDVPEVDATFTCVRQFGFGTPPS